MKMTVDKYFKIDAEYKKKRETLQEEINDLTQQEMELVKAAEAVAASGDVDAFMQKKAEKEKVSAAIFVKRSYLDKMPKEVTDEDAKEAWNGYADDYNKQMKKGLAEFEEIKARLCKAYSDLVTLQRDALEVRDKIADISGNDKNSFEMMFIPVRSGVSTPGLLKLVGFGSGDADAAYYMANYCKDQNKNVCFAFSGVCDPEEQRITNVVIRRNLN